MTDNGPMVTATAEAIYTVEREAFRRGQEHMRARAAFLVKERGSHGDLRMAFEIEGLEIEDE